MTYTGYIMENGEASLSRVISSSIGASYKQHISPPTSPHTRAEDRKKKAKQKRSGLEDVRKGKNLQTYYRSTKVNIRALTAFLSSHLYFAGSLF